MDMNKKFVFACKKASEPSRKALVLAPLTYLACPWIIPFVLGWAIGFYGALIGLPTETIRAFVVTIARIASPLALLLMTIFLVNRYKGHLLGSRWKSNLSSRLWVGLKWSIPYILFGSISVFIPEHRAEHLRSYFLQEELSSQSITPIVVALTSANTLTATFLEEVIFRGMLQQHIKKFISPRRSVLITASIFTLAHFAKFLTNPFSFGDIVAWFLVGIFAGFAFNKHNSCISAFIPHLVFNLKYIMIVPLILTL